MYINRNILYLPMSFYIFYNKRICVCQKIIHYNIKKYNFEIFVIILFVIYKYSSINYNTMLLNLYPI